MERPDRSGCVTMGHRALVAYEHADGRYDVHYTHWGGQNLRLANEITPRSPLGAQGTRYAVDPDPIALDLSFEELIVDCLDFLGHEALFVVATDFEVTAYRVCWFGVHTADGVVEGDPVVGRGALVSVSDDPRDDGYVLGWFDGLRESTGELIDRGVLDECDVVPYLVDRVERFAGDDREVIVDPIRDRP